MISPLQRALQRAEYLRENSGEIDEIDDLDQLLRDLRDVASETEGIRVAAARWQDSDDLAGALGIETGSLHWHEMIDLVRERCRP